MREWINLKSYISTIDSLCKEHHLNIDSLKCKDIAVELGVTPATLSNLSIDSKFSLIRDICFIIHDHYCLYFDMMNISLYDIMEALVAYLD